MRSGLGKSQALVHRIENANANELQGISLLRAEGQTIRTLEMGGHSVDILI